MKVFSPRTRHDKNQRGIALGPILFIIAILAVIAAAIAASSGGFNANTNTESNKSIAQTMVNYAGQLHNAMDVVLHNGCLDTQIQFQAANPNAPSNGSCNIFDPRGGGMVDKDFSILSGALNTVQATLYSNWGGSYGHFGQDFGQQIVGIGPNTALLFVIADVSQAVCQQINIITGFNASNGYIPLAETFHFESGSSPYFQGIYYWSYGGINLGFTNNIHEGCVYDSYWPSYFYIGVLLAR